MVTKRYRFTVGKLISGMFERRFRDMAWTCDITINVYQTMKGWFENSHLVEVSGDRRDVMAFEARLKRFVASLEKDS